MRDVDLVAIINSHRRDALGYEDGGLSNERSKALDHYHGRPYGNEVEGRSHVVSKDLSETIDWAMPAILKVFVQSGNIAEFEPVGPEDEQLAQQESDVTNKVFMQDNNGFMVLHDAIKDSLMLKNGYIKHYWEETETTEATAYTGLTLDEVAKLFADLEGEGATVKVEGQESRQEQVETPMGPQTIEVFDIRLRVTRKEGKVRCAPVPPEELRVSRRCTGPLSTSPFVEHVTRKTRTDLLEMGMSRSFVDSLPAFSDKENNTETLSRDSVDDESNAGGLAFIDKSMDEIEYCECYIKVDWDGDGSAELRKVVTVADRIPPGDEWNEEIDALPISGGVPKRIPHRHIGESLDDDIADLQEIKTTLIRQMLDNIYATNNNQWLVNERVNLQDFLQSLPGGIKRVKGMEPIAGAVEPVVATPIMQQIMPAIDYIDGTKESRTGINRATTGLDPDVLKQSTKGAFMENLNRASQKIEMITRMLAETLVRPTMLAVHALLIKHQNKPMVTRLRGKFVQVNPQEWRRRTDIILKVGIGTGNEEEKRQKLMLLTQMQDRLLPMGLVGPMQAYTIFADMARAMGFDMPEKYAMSPDSPEFQKAQQQPKPPDPIIQVKQMELQADAQKFQAETVVEQRNMQMQAELDRQKAEFNMQQELVRSQNDVAIEQAKIQAQAELERWKAELAANVALEKERMATEAKLAVERYKADSAMRQQRMAMMAKDGMELDDEGNVIPGAGVANIAATIQAGLNEALSGVTERVQELLDAHRAPKTIERGPDGRPISVGGRQIIRGPDGKVMGLQ